jgi:hypothetical protein
MLQEDLRNALRQIDELKARNRELQTKLLLVGDGKRDTVPAKQTFTKCMVVGESVLRSVGLEYVDKMVECFTGIKTEQINSVMEKSDLGGPETVIIPVCTNDLRTTRNIQVGVDNLQLHLPRCVFMQMRVGGSVKTQLSYDCVLLV